MITKANEDHTIPATNWVFDEEVTKVFGNMLDRSIPQYKVMREASTDISEKFFRDGDIIIDLGCSDGRSIDHVFNRLGNRAEGYYGVDTSEAMLNAARDNFKNESLIHIQKMDLREDFPDLQAGIIQALLCLCFIPIEHRQKVVSECYSHLRSGGVLVIVDKMLGETSEITELFVERYHQMKADNGYTEEEIDRKRLSLQGVLVPITPSWLISMLKDAGFAYVDCFWRWMNFAGWVAIKA